MDRGTETTLALTIPRSLFKSYTKDLSHAIFELVIQHRLTQVLSQAKCRYNVMILDETEVSPILIHDKICAGCISPLFSMDSGLEAFSLNPAPGSVSALTFQSTEFAN